MATKLQAGRFSPAQTTEHADQDQSSISSGHGFDERFDFALRQISRGLRPLRRQRDLGSCELDGGHYLHRTQSVTISQDVRRFVEAAGDM